ncbi:hypothetical protein [Micromonospora sp. NPDC049891]|uniref:hypothetical protein n=1 Tax=Micromonospora sp. NPDC049891 TaxID=3155655 RepID=UPI0033F07FD5
MTTYAPAPDFQPILRGLFENCYADTFINTHQFATTARWISAPSKHKTPYLGWRMVRDVPLVSQSRRVCRLDVSLVSFSTDAYIHLDNRDLWMDRAEQVAPYQVDPIFLSDPDVVLSVQENRKPVEACERGIYRVAHRWTFSAPLAMPRRSQAA